MVWQPTGGHTPMDQDIRVGSQRPSMEVNPLLTHPELGTVKKILFNNPPKDKVFGFTPPKDPEGAREVMMIWKGHQASPSQDVTKPSPDFKTLNKMAVSNGLSDAKDLPFFRKMHPDVLIKTGNETRSPSATQRSALPSIPPAKTSSTFGMPSAHRSAEVIRSFGPEEPPVKYLVQGAYQDEWVRRNLEAEVSGGSRQRPYIPPQPTKAALGHSLGASRYLQPPIDDEPWKMSKFKTVDPRVTKYTGGSVIRHNKSTAPVADIAEDTAAQVAGA